MACNPTDLVGCTVGTVVGQVADDALQQLVDNVLEGAGKAIAALGSFWVYLPTPDLTGGAGGAVAGPAPGTQQLQTILGWVVWVALAV